MRPIEEIAKHIKDPKVGIDGVSGLIHMSGYTASLIVSSGAGWEHASIAPLRKVTPSWEDMCKLKDLVWEKNEAVIQIHPSEVDYVDIVSNCLRLWRCTYKEMVLPPAILVGPKPGMTRSQMDRAIKEAYEMAGEKLEGCV